MGNIDDQHRNTNMNDKDHLVGQLTNLPLSINTLPIGSMSSSDLFYTFPEDPLTEQRKPPPPLYISLLKLGFCPVNTPVWF